MITLGSPKGLPSRYMKTPPTCPKFLSINFSHLSPRPQSATTELQVQLFAPYLGLQEGLKVYLPVHKCATLSSDAISHCRGQQLLLGA